MPGGVQAISRIIAIHPRGDALCALPPLWRYLGRTPIAGKTTAQCGNLSSLSDWRGFSGAGVCLWPVRSADPQHHRPGTEAQWSLKPSLSGTEPSAITACEYEDLIMCPSSLRARELLLEPWIPNRLKPLIGVPERIQGTKRSTPRASGLCGCPHFGANTCFASVA